MNRPDRTLVSTSQSARSTGGRGYHIFKRSFDIVGSLLLLPVFAFLAIALLCLNPFFNRGKLFFLQDRMGQDCKPFRIYKFRSMVSAESIKRGAFDELEHHRIRPFGKFLRRSRLDELPQVLNVLKGEMSLIGPRPDFLAHAMVYMVRVPGYIDRHAMRPGISGYAQVVHGYSDAQDAVDHKVAADLTYIRTASVGLDLWILWQTILIVCLHRGK